jgi:hypothetical protein|nr:MAG TPA: hypothetical protein [Bacteriophage sp.]
MAKIFKCKGIPYYITGCYDKITTSVVAIKNRWGVTPDDLIEVESIDDVDAHVVDKSKFYSE